MLSIIKLLDVKDEPKVKQDLPESLRVGDPLALKFRIERQNGGRIEELRVDLQFRVKAIGVDASSCPSVRLLSVEPVGPVPKWHSIKKTSPEGRSFSPAKFPRTPV